MAGRIAARIAATLAILAGLAFAAYALIALMPGDPIDLMLAGDPRLSPEAAARLKALYGLDRHLVERFSHWAARALTGDLGWSRLFQAPVVDLIRPAFWNTLILVVASQSVALALAVPLAAAAALRRGGWADRVVELLAALGSAAPSFWIALLLMLVFAVGLGWLPAGGMGEPGAGWGEAARHLVLPAATLAVHGLALYLRVLKTALMGELAQDYVRTARAKGCARRRVLWVHVWGNAARPFAAIAGLQIGSLLGGALVTETLFGWRGLGKLLNDAILGNDYNLAMAALLIGAGGVVIVNATVDAMIALSDPRREKPA